MFDGIGKLILGLELVKENGDRSLLIVLYGERFIKKQQVHTEFKKIAERNKTARL